MRTVWPRSCRCAAAAVREIGRLHRSLATSEAHSRHLVRRMRELEREKTQLVRTVTDLDRRLKDATALVVPADMRTGYPGLSSGAPLVLVRWRKACYCPA